MALGQIERSRLASQRFRNSFERSGVISARRLPRVFLDFVDINLSHLCHSERSRGISGLFWTPEHIQRCLDSTRHDNGLFFAIEVIGLSSSHDQFFRSFPSNGPFAAVGIGTETDYFDG